MKPRCTKVVDSFVKRLLRCRVLIAKPSRTLWLVALLPMLPPLTVAKWAVCAYNVAATTSDCGISEPAPSAREKWNRQATKSSGRKHHCTVKLNGKTRHHVPIGSRQDAHRLGTQCGKARQKVRRGSKQPEVERTSEK